MAWALQRSWGILPPFGTLLNPFGGAFQQLRATEPLPSISALQTSAEVVFDEDGVPYIFAQNDHDLYLLQGYLPARDRLWQMEFQTHAAAGRLSEIIADNADVLDYDRKMRRTGMRQAAKVSLKEMQGDSLTALALAAYAKGVNTYIEQLEPKDYPLEYKILDYAPEAWTPLKSAFLLKYMARDLSSGNRDLEFTNALQYFGKEIFARLYPPRPVGDPIIETPKEGWNFTPIPFSSDSLPRPYLESSLHEPLIESPPPVWGSNNWAVDSSKTASGNAILCGDPHLGLGLPSLWYRVQLQSPTHRVSGVSLPGAPGVIIGFTDSVAWSPTNAARDLVDWFAITFEDSTRDRYRYEGEWRFTKERIEEIRRRGEEPFMDTVVYTHLGPVVYDRNFGSERQDVNLAMRWIAHDPSNELRTFLLLNRAKNHEDYKEALRTYQCPAQNFAFADANGQVAMTIQGKFPLRRPDQGKFILDGQYAHHTWQDYIPTEHNASIYKPSRGYVSSANQFPTDSLYPYYVFSYSYETYRNRTLNRMLDTLNDITPQDMMRLQTNNFSYKAYESLSFLLEQLDPEALSEPQRSVFDSLKAWDFYYNSDRATPAYFEAWWWHLEDLTWDEFENDSIPLYRPQDVVLLQILRDTLPSALLDNQATPEKELAVDLIRKSFQQAVDSSILVWQDENPDKVLDWQNYKATEIRHVARIPGMGAENLSIGGYRGILNATSKRHGPSWRMIVELTPTGPEAWGIYPGGQSGNPANPLYDNWVTDWSDGRYRKITFAQNPESVPNPSARYTITP
ncbi:MAG: penicillin acylase family protein [Bacteroidota bacterium]